MTEPKTEETPDFEAAKKWALTPGEDDAEGDTNLYRAYLALTARIEKLEGLLVDFSQVYRALNIWPANHDAIIREGRAILAAREKGEKP